MSRTDALRAGFPAGFGPVFAFGLRTTCRPRAFLLVLGVSIGLGVLIGVAGIRHLSPLVREDRTYYLWRLLDEQVIRYLLPLVSLVLITPGFAREVQQRTLVYHLARPVSRTTVFLARYLSGLLPAIGVGTLTVWAILWTSGEDVPPSVWLAAPAMAALCALLLGSIYYVLGSLFRWGIILGLVYTFVFETLFVTARGVVQKLSMAYHVRSLYRGIVNEDLAARSKDVADAIDPDRTPGLENLRDISDVVTTVFAKPSFEDVPTAVVTGLAVTAAVLAFGVWRTKRRDFPLKD